MRVLVIGCGLVGKELAGQLRADGHHVIGTTTTPGKVDDLKQHCDEVKVLRGSDKDKVHAAAEGCDAIAVCAGPAAQQAMTPEQRKATYHKILVETAESAATAPISGPIVAISSLSVYGDAADHLALIDEDAPVTDADDASPAAFQGAERAYRAHAPSRHAIFRCSDIMGGDDPPIELKLKMAHQVFKGNVPFQDRALFYRVHQMDVVRAIKYAIDHKLNGTFNLTHEEVPPSNADFFNAICDQEGLPHLQFRNELKQPGKPVSVKRILDTGFRFEHTEPERMPEAGQKVKSRTVTKKELDFVARDTVQAVLKEIVEAFDLKEHKGEDDGSFATLKASGGPLEGMKVGELRVFSGGPIHKLVYSGMTVEEFGMDTHQIWAYTAPDSALPHFTIDAAISPNTEGTFHIGVDLIPRLDLGASLRYLQQAFQPLQETYTEFQGESENGAATSVGPMQYALRSPYMMAAFASKQGMKDDVKHVQGYLKHWIKLLKEGLNPEAQAEAQWQNPAQRDALNRKAIFNPETNMVWGLLDKLIGEGQGQLVRDTLSSQDI